MPNLNYLQEHLGPIVNNIIDLGHSLLRWRKIWTVALDISGVGTASRAPTAGTDIVNKTYADALVNMTVEEVDGSPSYTGISTWRFDQADGFVVTNPAAGVARIDMTTSAGVSTVREVDLTPAVTSVTILEFDQADGFVITEAVAGTARVDITAIPDANIAALAASKLTGTVAVASGGTNIASYTAGDILTATAATTLAKLPKGTANQVLGMNSGATTQEYKTIAAGTGITVNHTANNIEIVGTTAGVQPSFMLSPVSAAFPATNFPQLVKNVGTNFLDYTLDFDTTTSEICYWTFLIPSTAVFTAATIKIFSRQAAQTSGTLGWTVTTLTRSNGEAWDTAGNADTVTASTVAGTAGQVLAQSKALTVTGWAAGELLCVKFARDIADSVTEDGKFIYAEIELS